MAGRPRKPRVKVRDLLTYIESLPEDNRLKQKLTPDKMLHLRKYIEELEYLDTVIIKLKADIKENGEIEIYTNGAQQTRRTNPALTTLIDTLKAYNQFFRQASGVINSAEIVLEKEW